jgi:hypothetical protein
MNPTAPSGNGRRRCHAGFRNNHPTLTTSEKG